MLPGEVYTNNEKDSGQVVLPDETQILVFPGTKVAVDSGFGKSNFKVVIDGQGFFTVKRADGEPLEVWTRSLHMKVLGSLFYVDAFSYVAGEEVDLLEGKMWVGKTYVSDTDNKPETIGSNELVMINRDIDLMEKETMNATDLKKVNSRR